MSCSPKDFKNYQKQQKIVIKNAKTEITNAVKELSFLFNQKIDNSTPIAVNTSYDTLIQNNFDKVANALCEMNLTTCEVCVKPTTAQSPPPVHRRPLSFEIPVVSDSQETQDTQDTQETQKTQDDSQGVSSP